eukprot:CAMPEP_0175900970 /NCGR_PEP_ID=MMETSP0108-20121206/2615_1 /TAXON_ID=195067 ORGANISM="Goniomonas pacifica, Strain CCMP1869" /NCGR_SAMPLE_ID=MMETSP0108 /ASSEMBLY_ACC=CAM_ASM_000204 /LENGTH=380 /DNA_ID=CAMNT_0017222527 /DNA_START=9 /DNA_END=1152 /DNA_ORIENTATION=-
MTHEQLAAWGAPAAEQDSTVDCGGWSQLRGDSIFNLPSRDSTESSISSPVFSTPPSVGTPLAVEACNMCNKPYTDWLTGDDAWGLIPEPLQLVNLCVPCFNAALAKTGWEIKQVPTPSATSELRALVIQMEYCQHSLQVLTVRNQLPTGRDVWKVMQHLASALAFIHAMGIIHRDLKTEGWLRSPTLDSLEPQWGSDSMARPKRLRQSSMTQMPSSALACPNTPLHHLTMAKVMAPEASSGSYSHKSDVYSLGLAAVILWGRPVGAGAITRLLANARHHDFSTLHCPPAAISLLQEMLRDNPDHRPSAFAVGMACDNALAASDCSDTQDELAFLRRQRDSDVGLIRQQEQTIQVLLAQLAEARQDTVKLRQALASFGSDG